MISATYLKPRKKSTGGGGCGLHPPPPSPTGIGDNLPKKVIKKENEQKEFSLLGSVYAPLDENAKKSEQRKC